MVKGTGKGTTRISGYISNLPLHKPEELRERKEEIIGELNEFRRYLGIELDVPASACPERTHRRYYGVCLDEIERTLNKENDKDFDTKLPRRLRRLRRFIREV